MELGRPEGAESDGQGQNHANAGNDAQGSGRRGRRERNHNAVPGSKQKRESKRKYGKTLIRRDARGTEIETRRQARERM